MTFRSLNVEARWLLFANLGTRQQNTEPVEDPMTNSQAGKTDKDEQSSGYSLGAFRAGAPLEPNTIILERYRVVDLLGRGGMGSVYHVKHLYLESDYALKVLDAQSNESTWRRFENEARAANRLDHPNLIKVHDSGLLEDGQPFFVMEMVPGVTLADLLKKKGRLPVRQTLNIIIQVGFALAYAHENGVIHRDLKPSNIMLVENGAGSLYSTVKLVDLGIAKLTGIDEFNQQTLTKTGEIFGSPLYMSPEQCIGVAVDGRSDLYSLGCVMYEALTGAPPVIGDTALATMMKHQSEKPLSLKEASLGINFPPAVEQVVAKLLEKDANDRYANAQSLTQALVNIQQELQETESTEGFTVTAKNQVREKSGQLKSAFRTGNIVSSILITGAFALGYWSGECSVNQSEPARLTEGKESSTKAVKKQFDPDDPMGGVPKESLKFLDGQAFDRSDLYMNTGKGYFSTPVDSKTVRFVFPEKSIGLIGIAAVNGPTKWLHEARGSFNFPLAPVAFEAHKDLYSYPNLMEKFRKNELNSLALKQQFPASSTVLLAPLNRQANLIELNLNGTTCSDQQFEAVKKMTQLKRLFLGSSGTSGKAISTLPTLRQLTDLDISETSDASLVLPGLKGSPNLRYIRLKNCRLTRKDLEIVASLPNLVELDLNKNDAVNDRNLSILSPLKKLRILNLENCPITLACLKTLQNLAPKKLIVERERFKGKEAARLRRALPGTYVDFLVDENNEIPDFRAEAIGKGDRKP